MKILEREATIGELETRVEMLKSASSASSDLQLQGLMASNESDKVAASRAMAQNLRLKDQLEELQMRLIELVSHYTLQYMPSCHCQLANCQCCVHYYVIIENRFFKSVFGSQVIPTQTFCEALIYPNTPQVVHVVLTLVVQGVVFHYLLYLPFVD